MKTFRLVLVDEFLRWRDDVTYRTLDGWLKKIRKAWKTEAFDVLDLLLMLDRCFS